MKKILSRQSLIYDLDASHHVIGRGIGERTIWKIPKYGIYCVVSFLARKRGISIPSVSDSVTRGQRIAEAKGCLLL
jgi:hypothetical protein